MSAGDRDAVASRSGRLGADNTHDLCAPVREMLAGYALRTLAPDETELVSRHVHHCPECRAELDDFEAVMGYLPYLAPPQLVPVRVRGALLTSIDEIGSTNPEQMIVLPPSTPRQPRLADRLRFPSRAAWRIAAPAAMLLVVLSIGGLLLQQQRINQQQNQIETAQEAADGAIEVLDAPANARFESELTNSSIAPNAEGRVIVNLEDNQAMLLAKGLQQPEDGQAYIVWLMIRDEFSRVAMLEIDELGRTQLIIDPPDALDHYEGFFITLEDDPETTMPSGPQILSGSIHPQGGFTNTVAGLN